jgi:hypothetical protein
MGNCIEKNNEPQNYNNEPKTILTVNSSLATIYSVSKQERENFYKNLTTEELYKVGQNDANAKRWADNREVKQFIRNQNRRAYD